MIRKSKRHSKFGLIVLAILALTVIASFGCSIKKPQSPSWITTWDVPISNKTYGITDLLEKLDDSLFVTDSLGNPAFSISQGIDTFAVGNSLTYSGVSISQGDSVGPFNIVPPSDQNASTNINDVLTVNFGVVSPTSFAYTQPLPALSRFSWIDVQSGSMDLQFYNGLEVDLDTFIVTVIDQADMHVVGVANYVNGLSYLETEVQTIDLSGQTISNNLSMDFDGHTPGGVLLNAGPQNLDALASFPGIITATAAQAETEEININRTVSTALTDSTGVQTATIASGSLQIDIMNYTQAPFSVLVSSLNFRDSNGMEIQIFRQINPGMPDQVFLDLAGYDFIPADSGATQYVNVDFNATAPQSSPGQYIVSSSDSVRADLAVSDITFESITGRIKPASITIDPMQRDIDIPEEIDQARLTQARLNLNLYNNSMVPADVNLDISGGGNSIIVNDRIQGKSSPSAPPQLTTITIGSQQLYDFLNPPPAQITISGDAVINPDYGIFTVAANDDFYGDFELYSPFALAIADTISFDLDINDTAIDPESRPNNFAETFLYGAIEVEFDSHLPLGISMTLFIGIIGDSTLYVDPSTLVLGPYTLESGITDSNGHVVQSIISNIADSLDSSELAIFDNDTLYFGQMINLLPTDSAGVQVLGGDYINIKSKARLQIQAGDNLWDNQ